MTKEEREKVDAIFAWFERRWEDFYHAARLLVWGPIRLQDLEKAMAMMSKILTGDGNWNELNSSLRMNYRDKDCVVLGKLRSMQAEIGQIQYQLRGCREREDTGKGG